MRRLVAERVRTAAGAVAGQRLAPMPYMSNRSHRPQKAELAEPDDLKPLVVKPLENLDDRRNNPKDIEVDEAAIRNGVEHGGTIESHAESLAARGTGGRKRSGAFGRYRAGRDISKKR